MCGGSVERRDSRWIPGRPIFRAWDPRDGTKRCHKLIDMIAIAVAGVICGADDWVSIAAFGRAKADWLGRSLELDHGIPSHDSFGRVFSLLAPEAFETCFRAWVESIRQVLPGEVIAVDGRQDVAPLA